MSRRAFIGVMAIVVLGGGAWWWSSARPRSFAVAVFTNHTQHPELDAYSRALAEAVRTRVATVPADTLTVAPALRDASVPRTYGDLGQLRADTSATHMLFGELTSTTTGLRISITLVDLRDGQHRWSRQWNRPRTIDGLEELRQVVPGDVATAVEADTKKDR